MNQLAAKTDLDASEIAARVKDVVVIDGSTFGQESVCGISLGDAFEVEGILVVSALR